MDHYFGIADEGLYGEEESVVREFLKSSKPNPRALVVGCGGGREAIALAKMGLKVTGIDLSRRMIDKAVAAAKQNGLQIKFASADLESFSAPEGSFDFVFISSAIAEHIRGRQGRVQFYEKARKLVDSKTGGLYVGPEIQPLRSSFFWASQILRLRWRMTGHDWEPGDSARSFFGRHNQDHRLVFYHFYPTRPDFEAEIQLAGLRVASDHEGGFLLKPINKP